MTNKQLIKKLKWVLENIDKPNYYKAQLHTTIMIAAKWAAGSKEGYKVYFTGKWFGVTCGLAFVPDGSVEMIWLGPNGLIDYYGMEEETINYNYPKFSLYIMDKLSAILRGAMNHLKYVEEYDGVY